MAAKSDGELRELFRRMEDTAEFSELALTDVNSRGNLGNMPLHVAAVWGDVRAMKCLLDHGADVNVVGEFGETPLHIAVQMRHPDEVATEVVEMLLDHGALTNIKNELGKTPVDLVREVTSPIARLFE
jgi:ankyrin repeat protein